MTGVEDGIGFIRDVVHVLAERGLEARELAEGSEFDEGRALAYAEVLSVILHQAEAFGLPLERVGLAGSDPIATLVRDLTAQTDPRPADDEQDG